MLIGIITILLVLMVDNPPNSIYGMEDTNKKYKYHKTHKEMEIRTKGMTALKKEVSFINVLIFHLLSYCPEFLSLYSGFSKSQTNTKNQPGRDCCADAQESLPQLSEQSDNEQQRVTLT